MSKKLWIAAAVASVAFSARLAAADEGRADREKLLNHLQDTRHAVLDAVQGLSERQGKFRAGPDRWTVAECVEHLALVEALIRERIAAVLETAPKLAGDGRKVTDEDVLRFTANRNQKFQAPEPVRPLHRYESLGAAVRAFMEERVKTLEMLADTRSDLRAYSAPNPALGDLDGIQWGYFLSGHTARHTQQILEIKAAPGFPE